MTTTIDRPATARLLDLQPHPEGGWFRQTWRSDITLHLADYPGPRATATAIYFLLTATDKSAWHTVRSPELWLWHRGGPLRLTMGGTGDSPSAQTTTVVLGPDLAAGQQPQVIVPAGVWQRAEPADCDEALVSTVVSPGFEYDDFRLLAQN
ncbi:cupin domain-containing protein [Streptomyces sp. Da 82-17]|uniref:cupin domain-containing protein n=1 Tax=Streptomyces sp. Da 82-17 TaxID=3377116 RepID=UPI0038D4EBF1